MKVSSLTDIKTILQEDREYIATHHGVSRVGIFGSFVFGDVTPKSDVDILSP